MTRIADITNDSETSSTDGNPEERTIKTFCKSMLRSSLFIGNFHEKRYVEPLNAYRDIIKVADNETEFIENLKAVKRRCSNFYCKSPWIGITEPESLGTPVGYNLWVTLDEEIFGVYWFKVKRVIFRPNEISLKLDIVRKVTSNDNSPNKEIKPIAENEQSLQDSLQEFGAEAKRFIKESIEHLFKEVITIPNIKSSITFLCLLIFTLVTFSIEAIKYLMEYTLKLVRECSGLIKASTPLLQSLVGLVSHTINGFYRLLAMMFFSMRNPPPPRQPQVVHFVPAGNMRAGGPRAIGYGSYGWNQQQVNPRYISSGVRIREMGPTEL